MADFRTALEALAKGELTLEKVVENLEKLLGKSPKTADKILQELQAAYKAGTIDAQTYIKVKDKVDALSGKSQPGESDEKTEFAGDDSTQLISEDERTQIADEARAVSSNTVTGGLDTTSATVDFDLSAPASSTSSSWTGDQTGATGTSWGGTSQQGLEDESNLGPGSVIKGRFQLDEVLGIGGMGKVYKGRDLIKVEARDRNPYLALKVLNEDFKAHPDAFIALQREASRQQKLAHPNIATVYDFDRTAGGTVFLTMELLEGQALNTFIKKVVKPKGGLPFEEAFPMIEGLGKALVYAHDHYIVHSDFKPGNCFIGKDGTMKVLDFGIARAVKNPQQGDGEKTLFDPGQLGALTPAYASTEMLEGEEPDTRDDTYALACVAYELLTGKHPFNKIPANKARDSGLLPAPIKSLKRKQMKGLMRGLAFARKDRSQTVQEFLDELESKTNPLKNPLIIGPAIVLVLALGSIGPVTSYLHNKEIEGLIGKFNEGNPTTTAELLTQLPEMDSEDQDKIRIGARDSIIAYFKQSIDAKLDTSSGDFDFPGADRLVNQVSGLYRDSAAVINIRNSVEESRNQILSDLTRRFNGHLKNGTLVPTEAEDDIKDVLDMVAKVDPTHPLLHDRRLPGAYSNAIANSRDSQDFSRALDLVAAGLVMLPTDVNLSNLKDQIEVDMEKAEESALIAELERRIGEQTAQLASISDLAAIKEDILRLSRIRPDNLVLSDLKSNIAPIAKQDVEALIDNKSWDEAGSLLSELGNVMKELNLGNEAARLDAGRQQHIIRVDEIADNITAAVMADKLAAPAEPNATTLLANLAEFAARNPRTAVARDQISQAYLSSARLARVNGDLATARKLVGQAEQLQPGQRLSQSLTTELALINSTEQQGPVEVSLAKVDELKAEFEQQLNNLQVTALADADAILSTIDQIEALNPKSEFLADARSRLGDKVSGIANTAAEQGEYEQAITLSRDMLAMIPTSDSLSSTVGQLKADKQVALAQARQKKIDAGKERIASLMATPTLDRAWETEVQDELHALSQLVPEGDTWLQETRASIANLFVTEASKLRTTQSYAKAQNLLDKATGLSPDLESLAVEQSELTAALDAFEQQRLAQEKEARVEGLKQTFITQTKAKQVTDARTTLDELQRDLPADDAFITDEAPAALADAYLNLSKSKADTNDYGAALKFAKAGLEYAPDNSRLRKAVSEYTLEGNIENLNKTFASASKLDIDETRRKIEEILIINPGRFSQVEGNLIKTLINRIQQLESGNPETHAAFARAAQEIFPDNAKIRDLVKQLPPVGGTPEALKQRLQSALDQGDLEAAVVVFDEAKQFLKADDPLLTTEGPELLAKAFVTAADGQAQQGGFVEAAKLAIEGLKHVPENKGLLTARNKYSVEAYISELRDTFNNESSFDTAKIDKQLGLIRRLSRDRFQQAEEEFSGILAKRIETLNTSNKTAGVKLLNDALAMFPENETLVALIPPPPDTRKPTTKPEPGKPEPEKPAPVVVIDKYYSQQGARNCSSKLAGYGNRKQGRCYNFIGNTSKGKKLPGPLMVVVPKGEGIDKPFAIGKYEVSVADYNRYCAISHACKQSPIDDRSLPITGISLDDANAYAKWLSKRTGQKYRLPTEKEWEYAANAQGDQPRGKPWNCRLTDASGNYIKGQTPVSINSGKPNGWGLINYIGNAQEWVDSPSGKTVRGAAYTDNFSNCEIAMKRDHDGRADGSTGFRLVQDDID